MFTILLILLLLCWGSFLNQLAYRLVHDNIPLNTPRSQCPHCLTVLPACDLIPLLSWVCLRGRCRSCQHPITVLYPLIELLTVVIILPLFYIFPAPYWLPYFIFCSALIITIRTDLETWLISDFVTVYLIPLALLFSGLGYLTPATTGLDAAKALTKLPEFIPYVPSLPITIYQSLLGAVLGYSLLWTTNWVFSYFTGKQGLGTGDLGLLALIGAFTGPLGCWCSLLLGSLLGSLVGIYQIATGRQHLASKLPFGPYLALGALGYLYGQTWLTKLLLY